MQRAVTCPRGCEACSGRCSLSSRFGIVAIFASIPHSHIIYAVAGLVIFGGFTIVDFNRLRRANAASAVGIAASIFLDIFNVFLLLLQLFGGGRE